MAIVLPFGVAVVLSLAFGVWTVNRVRRRAEEALRAGEAKYLATLAALPDVLFVMSDAGVIQECYARDGNAHLALPGHLVGRRLHEVLPSDRSEALTDAMGLATTSDQTSVVEYSLEMGDRARHYEARIVRCASDRMLSIVRDVTERKRFELILAEREAALLDSHRENHVLAGRLIVAQEIERRRIARDLHDDLGQKLALLNIGMDSLAAGDVGDPGRLKARLSELSLIVADIAEEVHDLSHELHPSKLETLGLVTAIGSLCRDMSIRHNILIDFRHRGGAPRVDLEASLQLYRITQEALHNIVKHSSARQALVELESAPRVLELRIADQGRGFDAASKTRDGLGRVSMRERARIAGGEFALHSARGLGTRLGVRLPLRGNLRRVDPTRSNSVPPRAGIA